MTAAGDPVPPFTPTRPAIGEETHPPVSWSAVFAGATVSVALAFVVTGLGAGFGMDLMAPWPSGNPQLGTFEPMTGVWLVVVQVLAGGLGGYIAGRLRNKWSNVHDHEVFFRDTAHGLIAWAAATVAGVLVTAVALHGASAATVTGEVAQQFALFMTIALLLGAFMAMVAAALGGMRRDEMHKKHRGD